MNLTEEQQDVVDYALSVYNKPTDDIILVKAIAGSGKTALLQAISKTLSHTNGLNLCYNKSIAVSAQSKFPRTTACMTTHAMANRAVVKEFGLKVGTFNYRSITDKLAYEEKCLIVDLINEFCLSKYTDYKEYSANAKFSKYDAYALKYLEKMRSGSIECSHAFYLKLFHMLLADGSIEYDPFDFIMLDEAGDLNEVTLEIFKLLPSKLKIAVGDPHQNIYSFNHTINCFTLLEDQGVEFNLSKSFRVPNHISTHIEKFCQTYLDPDMKFDGVPVTDTSITTRAYITRTNSSLIARMVELNRDSIPYGLVRNVSEIFKLPLMLAGMKYQNFVTDPHYKHLQADFDTWYEDQSVKKKFTTPYSYIMDLYEEDIQLVQACKLINQYGKKVIFDTYYEAKSHEYSKQSLILTTAHSSKGLEFDEVTIANDLNDTLAPVLEAIRSTHASGLPVMLTREMKDSLNLYYVACSRALKQLNNAIHLRNIR